MKFGKLLQSSVEETPEMSEVFLRYRELKKQLKRMPHIDASVTPIEDDIAVQQHLQLRLSSSCPAHLDTTWQRTASHAETSGGLDSAEEQAFMDTLTEDLNKLNEFFMNKEEEIVIRLQNLEDRYQDVSQPEEQQQLKSAFVKLHGEMVLLLHWSLLNFAAVVKILKKHDKQRGVRLRGPVLRSVLQQPFYSTEGITELVNIAETRVQELSVQGDHDLGDSHRFHINRSGQYDLTRRTQAALEMWKEMGEKASTPSTTYVPAEKKARTDAGHS